MLRYATHPQVRIRADIPVPMWGLDNVGRSRASLLARQPWISRTTRLVSSSETKALETAAIVAMESGLSIEVRQDLHENDRSSTGFVPSDRFEKLADSFFERPDQSVDGWETATTAQTRITTATADLMEDADSDVLIVGHGAVGTLLLCDLLRIAISRTEDQVGGDAAPGGGNYWSFDRSSGLVVHRWRPVDFSS